MPTIDSNKYSDNKITKTLNSKVKIKGINLNNKDTAANSVSNIISWIGCINILLSLTKKPEPNPIKISLVTYPNKIENVANIIKGQLIYKSLSWACLYETKGSLRLVKKVKYNTLTEYFEKKSKSLQIRYF